MSDGRPRPRACGCASIPRVRRVLVTTFSLALLAALVLAPAALADNDGRGFYGATNDAPLAPLLQKRGVLMVERSNARRAILFCPPFLA